MEISISLQKNTWKKYIDNKKGSVNFDAPFAYHVHHPKHFVPSWWVLCELFLLYRHPLFSKPTFAPLLQTVSKRI